MKVKNGSRMAWISVLNKEVDSTWVTDHNNGILDTSGTNTEITTVSFIGNSDPTPDATSGLCRS